MVLSTGTEEDNAESRVISEIEKSPEPGIHNILLKIIGNQILTPFVFVFVFIWLFSVQTKQSTADTNRHRKAKTIRGGSLQFTPTAEAHEAESTPGLGKAQ